VKFNTEDKFSVIGNGFSISKKFFDSSAIRFPKHTMWTLFISFINKKNVLFRTPYHFTPHINRLIMVELKQALIDFNQHNDFKLRINLAS
jgi:hypothetical protein